MKLFRILTKFLVTKRVIIFSLILLLLSFTFFIITSSVTSDTDYQIFFSHSLEQNYFQSGFVFLKWMTLINVLFLCTHAYALNAFDGLFISQQNRVFFVSIKLGTLIFVNTLLIVSLWLLYAIVSQLTCYYDLSSNDYTLGIYIIILGNYYIILCVFFYRVFKHIVGLFIPLIGFILSFILTDTGIVTYEIGGFLAINHLLFPDVLYTNFGKIQFLHSFLIIIILTTTYIMVIIEKDKLIE